ncbi:MAG: hypothetical protein NTZ49_01105 [Candidatus Parcubacteria bacterium]|nr:hypothetical protein [Candidatus Parcubacteria bacterium]
MTKKKTGFDGFWADLQVNNLFLKEARTVIWGQLDYKLRQVIVLYYGLDCESLSIKEIAEKLQISRNYVGQLKRKALRRCRWLIRQGVAIDSPWGKKLVAQVLLREDSIRIFLRRSGYPRVKYPFKPLDELNLSSRTAKRLKFWGITCLFDLAIADENELRQIYGLGPKSMEEIKACLRKHNLCFLKLSPQ